MQNNSFIKLIECPRDAMQGWKHFIPTAKKIEYINSLLQVGFDTIDFGSFVSPKAIPQMADTSEVIRNLELGASKTKLLAIVANIRGAEEAVVYDKISYLGFPFSVSATFQQRNTNSSIDESLERVADIQELCFKNNKQLVIYISMGFGNPYGDAYSEEIAFEWVNKVTALNVKIISLADTVGHEIGVHLHSSPLNWKAKIDAALLAGCKRFDGALKGIGGCPMADDDLVGNMDAELMIPYFEERRLLSNLNKEALQRSSILAAQIFD
jgi:hydroxymethylglutaryl-CoA lyase